MTDRLVKPRDISLFCRKGGQATGQRRRGGGGGWASHLLKAGSVRVCLWKSFRKQVLGSIVACFCHDTKSSQLRGGSCVNAKHMLLTAMDLLRDHYLETLAGTKISVSSIRSFLQAVTLGFFLGPVNTAGRPSPAAYLPPATSRDQIAARQPFPELFFAFCGPPRLLMSTSSWGRWRAGAQDCLKPTAPHADGRDRYSSYFPSGSLPVQECHISRGIL